MSEHDEKCRWCAQESCEDRWQHDRWWRGSETSWREQAAGSPLDMPPVEPIPPSDLGWAWPFGGETR